ncbi:branched-chain amino acid transport system substrate-binding protein [Paenibacillus phyllosphaerae]|uniref:Branched-chain amino acid transport system substrate-binding protein n=1 Tax=Paenibacillus phyllosphaerae TaxID=274593 RepID=A0A7W5FR89_9BACL|nr:ABC transporter substrate-binding protein [Paenibacillus phyllosphaerae]MBB3113804.1 branched-chain amino acid transport system substrate-binding protein [Paenibacillus phyllosphaerae]
MMKMAKGKRWFTGLVVAAMVGVLAGCGASDNNGENGGTAGANAPAATSEASSDPILIGMSTEATGDNAMNSVNLYQGVQVAVDQINAKGGIHGRQVELVVRDTEQNPTRGISIIRDFSQKEKVLAAIGGFHSTVMLAQSPVIMEEKLAFMVATSNVPASVESGMPWTFGVRMNANITAQYALTFIEKHFQTNKIAILHENGGYGKGAAAAMTKVLEEKGLKPTAVETFDNAKDKDMTAQVNRAKESGAEVIYLFGQGAANGYVLQAMDKLGWKVPVVGENGTANKGIQEVGKELANGVYAIQTANFNVEQTREPAKAFITDFEAKFGHLPTTFASAAQGYDGAMLLFQAIEKAGLTGDLEKDRQAIRDTLESGVGPYSGVIRDWEQVFTAENHDAIDVNSYLMCVWKDGKLVVSDLQ